MVREAFNAVAGVRLDANSEVGAVLSPRVALSYRPLDWLRGRVSYGRAFRAPNMVELYMPEQPLISGFVVMMPSPYLKPEYVNAFDGGMELEFDPVSLTLNGFSNLMEDLISPALIQEDPTDPTSMVVKHRNISDAWSAGAEVSGTARWKEYASLRLSYTYTESWDATIGQPLDYVPKHSTAALLQFNIPLGEFSVSGSFTEVFVGKRNYVQWQQTFSLGQLNFGPGGTYIPQQSTLPSYWRSDATLRLEYRKRVHAAFTINNIFDEDYEESAGVRAPGRWASIRIGGNL
jgi:outer membrane receptor protein involved in Fe transport